jgi:small subunit ribosomal protein S7
MPRRYRPEKRKVEPDMKYSNANVTLFVNRLMYSGKKSVAFRVLYDSFELIEQRAKKPAIEVFEQALQNATPQIEVRPRRVGGSTYQVPTPVDANRKLSLSMRWLLAAARARGGRSMAEKLAGEFMDAANNQGAAVKRKDDVHRMADANRAFSHFRI